MLFLIKNNAFEQLRNPPKPTETPQGHKTTPINAFSYQNQCIWAHKEPAQTGWDAKRPQHHPKSMLFLIQINAFEHLRNPPKSAETPWGPKTHPKSMLFLIQNIAFEHLKNPPNASRPQTHLKSLLFLSKIDAFERLRNPHKIRWDASRPQNHSK